MSSHISLMHPRPSRAVGFAVSFLLAIGVMAAGPLPAASAAIAAPHSLKPVPGHFESVTAAVPKRHKLSPVPVAVKYPAAATYTVTTPQSRPTTQITTRAGKEISASTVAGAWQELGTSGIGIAAAVVGASLPAPQATGTPSSAPPSESLTAQILSAAQTKSLGFSGIAIELSRGTSASTNTPVAVQLPTSLLDGLYGANYASRLTWVETPTDSTSLASTQATRVASTTTATSTVLTPQVGATPMVLAATAAAVSSSGAGNFAATPFNAATAWTVSTQTGDFAWSVPLRTPPAPAGPGPDNLALSYDSQSIDGSTSATNNQSSPIGQGWSLNGGGSISRQFVSCAHDDQSPVAGSGDLCFRTDNETVNLGGHSGTLVYDSTLKVWKLQGDDGTTVTELKGTAAGCHNSDVSDICWLLTTTDGTKYYFGRKGLLHG
jgi:hypothetical protein